MFCYMTSEVHRSRCRPPQEFFSSLLLSDEIDDHRQACPTGPSTGHVLEILNLVTQFTVQTSLSCTVSSASWSFCLLPSCCAHSSCFIQFFYIKLWFNQLCLLHWNQFQTTTTATFKILRQTQQSLLCHLGSRYNFLAAATALLFLFTLY